MVYIIGAIAALVTAGIMYKWVDLSKYEDKSKYIIAGFSIGVALISSFTYNLITTEEPPQNDKVSISDTVNEKDKVTSDKESNSKDDKLNKSDNNTDLSKSDKSDDKLTLKEKLFGKDKSNKDKSDDIASNSSSKDKTASKPEVSTSKPGSTSKPSTKPADKEKPSSPQKPAEKPSKPAEKPSKLVEKPADKPSKPVEKPSKPADKVEYKKRQEREDLYYDIKVQDTNELYIGEEKVKTKGQNGYIVTEYTDKYVNGVKVDTTSKVIDKKDKVDEVILAGTKVKAYIDDAESRKMLSEVNAHRRANGKSELQWDETLYQAAKVRAEEILEVYDHVRPNGSDWSTAMDEYGIQHWGAGENIAAGYISANGAFEAWKASPGHNNNMLDEAFTHMASAKFETSYGGYWVQLFIRK